MADARQAANDAAGSWARIYAVVRRIPAGRVATTVLHYVLGFAWHEQQRLQYDSVGVRGEGAGAALRGANGAGAADAGAAGLASDDFAFGLDLIIAGLHARRRV